MKVILSNSEGVKTYSNVKEVTKTTFNDIVITIQNPDGTKTNILIESTKSTFISILDIN